MKHPLLFSISTFLLPISSFAQPVCEPLGNISQRVNYCDENQSYVEPAKACLQAYKNLVDAENAKIQSVLNNRVKSASGTQQSVDFKTTEKVLADADVTLTHLITQGRQVLAEFDAFTDDMVLPIYEAYPEDFELDANSSEGQRVFREKECYGEPMEDFDGLKKNVRNILADLEKTKVKTVSLHKLSNHKETDLGAIGSQAIVKSTGKGGPNNRRPASVNGKSSNSSSTITGVEKNKAKSKKLPSN